MKQLLFFLFLWMLSACQNKADDMVGIWKVNDRFTKASYQIEQDGRYLKAFVLAYDDGTTQYKFDGSKKHYAFTGLKHKKGVYVDGVSGATSKTENPKNYAIKKKHKDTLEVTTYILNKPIIETWIRK